MKSKAPQLKDGTDTTVCLSERDRAIIKAVCAPKGTSGSKKECAPMNDLPWADPIKPHCDKEQDAECGDCPLRRSNQS